MSANIFWRRLILPTLGKSFQTAGCKTLVNVIECWVESRDCTVDHGGKHLLGPVTVPIFLPLVLLHFVFLTGRSMVL